MNDAPEPASTLWPWAARGLVALAATGGLAARVPDTLEAAATVLGLYFLADAPLALLVATLGPTKTRPGLPMVFVGLVEVALAFVALVAPGASAVALLWPAVPVVGILLLGILQLIAASRLRRGPAQLLGAVGVVNVLLAVLLVWFPVPGVGPVALALGGYAALAGLAMLGLAVALRRPGVRPGLLSRTVPPVGALVAAAALGLLGGLLALPVGLILDDRVSWLLVLGVAGLFGALGAVWASTLLARTTAAVQLGRVLVATEVVAVGLWLVRLSAIGERLARMLDTNLAYLAVCAVVLAVVACLATGLAGGGRRDPGRLGRATLGLVVLVVVAVPAVVVVASWFGLVGA